MIQKTDDELAALEEILALTGTRADILVIIRGSRKRIRELERELAEVRLRARARNVRKALEGPEAGK